MKNVLRALYIVMTLSLSDATNLCGMYCDYWQQVADVRHQLDLQQFNILLNSQRPNRNKLATVVNSLASYCHMSNKDFLTVYLVESLSHALTLPALRNFIAFGADINFQRVDVLKGKTPLMLAAMTQSVHFVDELLHAGADALAQDNDKNTALIVAAQANNLEIVESLVQDLTNLAYQNAHEQNQAGVPLFPTAAMREAAMDWEACPLDVLSYCVRPFLPSDISLYVNHSNNLGYTALIYAATFNNFAMVQYLLENSADAMLKSKSGHTAYDLAIDPKVRALLQEYMA